MLNLGLFKAVIKEYGVAWIGNRLLYSAKLKLLSALPISEKCFEKKTPYPKRIDIFQIDIDELKNIIYSLDKRDQNKLIVIADKCTKGIIQGFSSVILDYGNPIDWQLNPLTNKRCDETEKWFQIPDFDAERGDIKIIWEASRFSHFLTLARAYLLTGNRKYYSAFSQQLNNWLQKNHYGYGANFKCGQECSIRMVNALLAFTIFKSENCTSAKDEENIKELVDRCYRKVLSNFFYAYKCIRNNHTISELMGMIVGAWCCEDEKKLSKAFRILEEVINEQFTEDGGYCQFSFNYQRLALQDLECILSIESTVKKSLSSKSKEKIKNAAVLMYQCQDQTGDVPNYGSNDGALIFPVTSCDYRDFKPVINTVYALTTGGRLYEEGKHEEELIWFSNKNSISEYPIKIIKYKASRFRKAGLFTLRNKCSWAMIILNEYKSRPGHKDQLHFDLWFDGLNVFCDGGTFSYASKLGKMLAHNKSHNTVTIGDKSQMKVYGPFLSYDWTERRLGECNDDLFEGTMISKNGYSHYRKVEQRDNKYIVTDYVEGSANYQVAFHTPCNTVCEHNTVVLFKNEQPICLIKSNGFVKIEKAKRSLYYLQEEEINTIVISCMKTLATKKEVITEIELIKKERKTNG